MIKKNIFLFLICIGFSFETQARVFNLTQETFASYLFFTGATPTNFKDSPWASESVATTTDKTYSMLTGGEFGFTYTSRYVNWRFGFEFFKPSKLNDITATQASGAAAYTLSSDLTGYAPKIGLEIAPWVNDKYRIFIFGYYGAASVTLKNDYTNVVIAPTTSHSVEMSGSGSLTGGGLGYETRFFDTTSFVCEAGYRALTVSEFKYTKAVTTFSGTVAAGDSSVKTDGTKRSLDLSGAYVTLGFRFYL